MAFRDDLGGIAQLTLDSMCLFMMTSSIFSWDSGAEIKVKGREGGEEEGKGRGHERGEEGEEGNIPFPSSFLPR